MKTTPSKYIDLAERIAEDQGAWPGLLAIQAALDWLDRNPEQVPGRTITDSELETITNDLATYSGPVLGTRIRVHLAHIGVSVVPDPEPTPRQLLEALIFEKRGDADDAQMITMSILDEFDVSVKAPGGEGDE